MNVEKTFKGRIWGFSPSFKISKQSNFIQINNNTDIIFLSQWAYNYLGNCIGASFPGLVWKMHTFSAPVGWGGVVIQTGGCRGNINLLPCHSLGKKWRKCKFFPQTKRRRILLMFWIKGKQYLEKDYKRGLWDAGRSVWSCGSGSVGKCIYSVLKTLAFFQL